MTPESPTAQSGPIEAVATVVGFDRGLPDLDWTLSEPMNKGDKLYRHPTPPAGARDAVTDEMVDEALFSQADDDTAMLIDFMGLGLPEKLPEARRIVRAAIESTGLTGKADGWDAMTKAAMDLKLRHVDNHQGDIYHALQSLIVKFGKPWDGKLTEATQPAATGAGEVDGRCQCGWGDSDHLREECTPSETNTAATGMGDAQIALADRMRSCCKHAPMRDANGCDTLDSWVMRWQEELRALAAQTAPVGIECYVGDMTTSAGMEYYVCFRRNGKVITPYRFKVRGKAEYEVAEYNHFFNDGPEPDILAYDTDEPIDTPAQPAPVVGGDDKGYWIVEQRPGHTRIYNAQTGDSCEVECGDESPHAEILRQLADDAKEWGRPRSFIIGAKRIDGVNVIIAKPTSDLLPEQLLVRYDDYLALLAARPGGEELTIAGYTVEDQEDWFATPADAAESLREYSDAEAGAEFYLTPWHQLPKQTLRITGPEYDDYEVIEPAHPAQAGGGRE